MLFRSEELILLNPMAYMYHVRYADIMYTMGTTDKGTNHETIRTSRKYYAHSLELKPNDNLRALYGLLLCCAALATAGKGKSARERDNAELVAFAKAGLEHIFTAFMSVARTRPRGDRSRASTPPAPTRARSFANPPAHSGSSCS